MKRWHLFLFLTLMFPVLCRVGELHAQIYDADGQYVDTVFHDHINRQADDFVTVSLVVCDPCDILYSTLGHTCLHLECPTFNLDYFFSYESENIRDKIGTFLRGNLKMGMFALSRDEFLQGYINSGRGVREYKLNMSPTQKQRLWEILDQKVALGANLPYDYFHKGCAKSVVMVMNEALGADAIQYAPWSEKYTKQTQREIVRNYIENAPWSEFEMYFLIGIDGDKDYPCVKKLIVPSDLVEVWQQAKLDGQPFLESEAHELAPSLPQKKATWCTPLLISIVLLVLALFSLATIWLVNAPLKRIGSVSDILLLSVETILGVVMAYLLFFSNLPCTNWNWLIIPFNPLPAIGWHWRKYWVLPYAVVLIIWVLGMLIYPHMLVDWSHLVLVLALAIMYVKQWLVAKGRK